MQVTLCSQLEMPIIFQMWRRKTVLANLEFFPHPASLWYWNLNRPDWRSMAPNKRVCLVSSELQISCSPNFAFQSLVLRGGAVQASANTPRLRLLYQNDSAQHQTLLLVTVTKQAQAEYQNDSAQNQTLLLVTVTKQAHFASGTIRHYLSRGSEKGSVTYLYPIRHYRSRGSERGSVTCLYLFGEQEKWEVLLHAYISLEGSGKIGTKQKKLLQHYQYHEHTTVEQHLHLINDSLYKWCFHVLKILPVRIKYQTAQTVDNRKFNPRVNSNMPISMFLMWDMY